MREGDGAAISDEPSVWLVSDVGAELTEVVDDKAYKGKVSVRIEPISLVFSGTVVFEEINQENLSVRAAVRGVDEKGRGGADAKVRFALEPSANGTRVVVDTTLNLSGSVAQYGRASGVIRGVANHLTTEFANNLKSQINAERTNSSSQPTDSPKAANPISAFGLLVKVVRSWLAELFSSRKGIVRGKLTGSRRP